MSDECHINFNCSCKNFDVPDNDDPVAPSREVTAEAKTLPAETPATAEVIADQSRTRFIFGIPAGEQGPPGEKGEKGDTGAQGVPGESPKMEYKDLAEWDITGNGYISIDLEAGNYYRAVGDLPLDHLEVNSVETSIEETVLEFTTAGGSTFFPASLKWIGEPEFEAGKTYLISIVNNIAVAAEVTA